MSYIVKARVNVVLCKVFSYPGVALSIIIQSFYIYFRDSKPSILKIIYVLEITKFTVSVRTSITIDGRVPPLIKDRTS